MNAFGWCGCFCRSTPSLCVACGPRVKVRSAFVTTACVVACAALEVEVAVEAAARRCTVWHAGGGCRHGRLLARHNEEEESRARARRVNSSQFLFRNDRPRTAHASLRGDLHTPHDPASRATRALPLLIQMWAPAVALRPRRTRRPHLQPSGRRRGAAAGAGAPCGSPSRRTPRQPWRSAACGACSSSAGCRAPRRTWCGRRRTYPCERAA